MPTPSATASSAPAGPASCCATWECGGRPPVFFSVIARSDSDQAIQTEIAALDCFVSLAMTVDASARHQPYAPMLLPPLESPKWHGPVRALALGMSSVTATVLSLVLFVTYIGIGALAHDTHFSPAWALMSTALVWAGPAQIILISTLASGASVVQSAIAVTVSAVRLFPMVVAVLPMMRTPQTKRRQLVLVAHFTAVTLWVECYRFLPHVPRNRRIAFVHGLGSGLALIGLVATAIGYELAANLTQTFGSAILLLTPLAFLFSTARNSRELADGLALGLGLALYPLASLLDSGLDILISGVAAGTVAFAVHKWRERA